MSWHIFILLCDKGHADGSVHLKINSVSPNYQNTKKKKSPTPFYLISLVSMMKHRKNTNKIDYILNGSSWKLFLEGKYEGGETRDLANGVYHTVILGITEYFEHSRFNLCI